MRGLSIQEEARIISESLTHDEAMDMQARASSKYFSPHQPDSIVTDISTFVNMDRIVSGSHLDGFLFFDLDVFFDLIILHDKITVLQPFDSRYPEMVDFDWIDKSSLAKELMRKKILFVRPVSGYDTPSWKATRELFRRSNLRKVFAALLQFDGDTMDFKYQMRCKSKISDRTWGIDRGLHYYNEFYKKIYSHWTERLHLMREKLGRKHSFLGSDLALLAYRTNECLLYSRVNGLPYHPHSLKSPIVKEILKINRIRLRTLVDSIVAQMDEKQSKKLESLNKMMDEQKFPVVYSSNLASCLKACKSKDEIIDVALDLRRRGDRLRKHLSKVSKMSANEMYDQLSAMSRMATGSIRGDFVMAELVPEEILQPIVELQEFGVIPLLSEVGKINAALPPSVKNSVADYLYFHLFKRKLLFLKELRETAKMVELSKEASRLFDGQMSAGDFDLYRHLRTTLCAQKAERTKL